MATTGGQPFDKPTGQQKQIIRTWLISKDVPPNNAAMIIDGNKTFEAIGVSARAYFKSLPKES